MWNMRHVNQWLSCLTLLVGFLLCGVFVAEASVDCHKTPKENALSVFKSCKKEERVGCKQLSYEIHESNRRRCGYMAGKRSDKSSSNSIAFPNQRPIQVNALMEVNRENDERSREPWRFKSILQRLAWNDYLERFSSGSSDNTAAFSDRINQDSEVSIYEEQYDHTIY